jgi:hypothetical protein
MDTNARTQLDSNYRTTVLDPLGYLIGVFPDFNDAIKKRHKKLLDYDRLRSGTLFFLMMKQVSCHFIHKNIVVRKLVDNPSNDPSKLPKAEQEANQARDLYETVNRQLITDIPKLIDLRIQYLHPSFEALVKSQLQFNEDAFYGLNAIAKSFPDNATTEGRVETALQRMKELTICRAI